MFAICLGATYATSRELFEAARDAAGESERTLVQLRRMEESEQRLGGGIVAAVSRGEAPDPRRRTDERLDLEAMMGRRLEEDDRLMDFATTLLYGEKRGEGGVAALLGTDYADLLWWRYLGRESWERASQAAGWSRRAARRKAEEAFDLMDALGAEHVREGRGMAAP